MSLKAAPYEYKKLEGDDEIRLLSLLPGRPGDSLKCRISHHALHSKPSYEALSYVWGPQGSQFDLKCQGLILKIGANLKAALCRLRRTTRERILWVDKICICQEDIDERGQQVSLMSDIFSIATTVIVWLGEAEKKDTAAFELLERLGKILSKERRDKSRFSSWSAQPTAQSYHTSPDELTTLKALLNNSWFTRAWTFQEAIFAKSALIVHGTQSMQWDTLAQCIKRLLSSDSLDEDDAEHIPVITSSAKLFLDIADTRGLLASKRPSKGDGHSTQKSAHELLIIRRSAEATDPRDKVFALVNASSDKADVSRHRTYVWTNQLEFAFHEPNYHMSVEQVYTAAARHAITIEKKLHILLSVEAPKADPTLPSWVPDWREPLIGPIHRPYQADQQHNYSATLDSQVELQDHSQHAKPNVAGHDRILIVHEPYKLAVRGIRFVRITAVGPRCPHPDSPDFNRTIGDGGVWQNMARACSMKRIYTPTGEDIEMAFAHTRLCYRRLPATVVQNKSGALSMTFSGSNDFDARDDDPHEWYLNCGQRRFFTTEDGYFGLGPVTARVGDLIYLLLGGEMPFIVRRDTNDRMTLVGAAYVHGLMQGEGIKKAWKKHDMRGKGWDIPSLEWVTLV